MSRIQRRRTKGWRMPPGAIYVGRPSPWGNAWAEILTDDALIRAACNRLHLAPTLHPGLPSRGQRHHSRQYEPLRLTRVQSVALYRVDARQLATEVPSWIAPLRGHDLACWCPLDQPCHADVLLELANITIAEPADRG